MTMYFEVQILFDKDDLVLSLAKNTKDTNLHNILFIILLNDDSQTA